VYPLGEDVATPFAEDAPLGESDKLQLGYSQSKWVAEKLVEEARARGLPVTVYRPGLVSGERRSGYERDPEHQLLYAFIAGCVAFGQAPALEKVIDASPVDWVAEAIAALSLLPEARGRRLNLINRAPIRQRELYAALRARGYVVDEIAYPRWRDRVLALEPGTSNPLARFIAFYKMMDEARMRRVEVQMRERLPIEDGDARALLGRVDLPSPPLDRRLVDTYLGYYVGQGLLPRPAAPPSAAPAPSSVLDRQRPPEIAFPDLFLPRSPKLEGFYERATERQWRARSRIDWSTPLDPHNPADLPDVALPIYGSPIFERLSAAERGRVRAHYQAWQLSQFLYGEQIALVATSQLIRLAPSADVQLFAGTQAADEARHLEIYTRLIDEKIGLRYPMVGPLSRLADVVFADDRWDITSLGIQILVEGLALASFAAMRDQSRNPLIVAVHTYVMEDEARHVGFGNRLLAPYYAELSDGERAEREELVIEASYLLRDRILATDEIWERCGLPPRECADWIRESGFQRAWGAALFSRIVPAIRAIGLWSTRVQDAYGKMGLLGHACRDLDDLRVEDERRADALDGRAGGEERARA
ncbi:MAG: SDR family oxidoreductase, partial [Myxococcales bacterium]|nr:SDR family oxidoreductase [Myxococcales bacterium]